MSSGRSDLTLGYLPPAVISRSTASTTNSSPTESINGGNTALRSPFGMPGSLSAAGKMANTTRSGAGSPSHDLGVTSRLYSKRAREIQAQEGVSSPWGPPTSGNSTPLRENIPESPTTDGFPGFVQNPMPAADTTPATARRARAGTVPSRFSPGGAPNGAGSVPALPKSARPTPSPSPFPTAPVAIGEMPENLAVASNAALLSRLRAGSMPQRSQYAGGAGPFGPAVFSTSWSSGRERSSTLASIASRGSDQPTSPAQSSFSREGTGENDMQMRTLDYLGLADTPQQPRATLAHPYLANIADINKNRFRSYSVNAKERYAEEEDDEYAHLTPYEAQQAQLQMQLAATNAAIQAHNHAVQAYANQASMNRPRARTAGVLDSPPARLLQHYYPSASRLDSSITAAEMTESGEYDDLAAAAAGMALGRSSSRTDHLTPDDALDGPTRALWLGNIPASTTMTTLTEMFKVHGSIENVRVLTHKNCGFVNYHHVESAAQAKNLMNGTEIFPGAGPVRINFAKPPSPATTPAGDGLFPSPSPDPFLKEATGSAHAAASAISRPGTAPRAPPALADLKTDILHIVAQFGAETKDVTRITASLESAIAYDGYLSEIPAIPEPSHNRIHDAPKLRDIRKRIDNQSWSQQEIENIAAEMLPEIAELSSDYLGNTVVQKLFEHCADDMRDAMLTEIAPHMAEIGVHKNGTWAAQKIIDVCKTPKQKNLIIKNLQPYTVPLFLDQYGNYVLQCCLKFGSPFNDFIFESMLAQMWEIAQGRYGARAMRACLESHHSTKDQQRMLAAAIALHSVQLATNQNGALLLTWLLDTCSFPNRRTVLAPQLVPNLVHLCTHKVAYLTVLKVVNQKNEPEARDVILKALFFSTNDETLEAILADHACGATLIFKVLTTPFFDEAMRPGVVENVRAVLLRIKAQPAQGYKRLMDEVGLSTRNGSQGPSREHGAAERQRPGSQHSQANAPQPFSNGQFFPPVQPGYDLGLQRNDSLDAGMSPYPSYGGPAGLFNSAGVQIPPINLQQLQYQQQLLARQQPPMGSFYPPMQSGFGYGPGSSSPDSYRNQAPIQPPQAQMSPGPMLAGSPFSPPGFGGMGAYGYAGVGLPGMGYMQQEQQVNSRRGRR